MKKIIFIVLFIYSLLNVTYSQNSWVLQCIGTQIRGMSFISHNTGYFATLNGILKTTNGGQNFLILNSPTQALDINFMNNLTGFVCGGSLYKTTNGGINWTQKYSNGYIIKLKFLNDNTGLCISNNSVFKTNDAGNNWDSVYNLPNSIQDFCFVNENTGWVASYANYTAAVIKTTNGGINWTIYNVSNKPYTTFVYFINNLIGWCGDNYGYIYTTTDGGITWIMKYYNLGFYSALSCYFLNSGTGWICGSPGNIIKTTNGGANWIQQLSGAGVLYDIYFSDSLNGYAGNGGGIIYKTTNGGNNWNGITQRIDDSYSKSLYFFNSNTGLILSNRIFKTTNSGINWGNPASLPMEITSINAFHFFNENTGITVGHFQIPHPQHDYACVYYTSNGGTSWYRQALIENSWGLSDVKFLNDFTGWCVGSAGLILKTTNKGTNWIAQNSNSSQNLSSVQFINNDSGFCTSTNGNILKTTNSGNSWIIQNIAPTGSFNSIIMINVFTGWIVGSNGQIFKTTNSGVNWSIQSSGTLNNLLSIFFINENTGWCCGQNLILKTVNSGITWKTDMDLSPVCFNSIYFNDANTGWVSGNGGIIFKTTTGGSSWILHNDNETPVDYTLYQNYPNPFNPVTKIKFDIKPEFRNQKQEVKLTIYDILGKEINILVNEQLSPGTYEITFDAGNLPSGIYFYQLRANEFTDTKKLILLK